MRKDNACYSRVVVLHSHRIRSLRTSRSHVIISFEVYSFLRSNKTSAIHYLAKFIDILNFFTAFHPLILPRLVAYYMLSMTHTSSAQQIRHDRSFAHRKCNCAMHIIYLWNMLKIIFLIII